MNGLNKNILTMDTVFIKLHSMIYYIRLLGSLFKKVYNNKEMLIQKYITSLKISIK